MPWYAIRSKPNKEEALWRELGGKGREVFYPYLRVRPVNPRSRWIRPYFPGYLFVLEDLQRSGSAAFSFVPYSHGLVSFDGQPAEVPDLLVSAIRTRLNEINDSGGRGFDAYGRRLHTLQTGDHIAITDGPFAGCQAIFDAHLSGVDRVRVLLQLLQSRPMKLDLPAAHIQPTNRH